MQKYCDNCGKPFLTEADLFVYQNTNKGEYYSCGCAEGINLVFFITKGDGFFLVSDFSDGVEFYLWGSKKNAKEFSLKDAIDTARMLAFPVGIITDIAQNTWVKKVGKKTV